MAVLDCGVLAIACLVTYWLATYVLSRIHSVSRADDMLGGLWAVIATVFVCRFSYDQSTTAAVSRVAATSVSFVLCLIYLIFLPFHAWALAVGGPPDRPRVGARPRVTSARGGRRASRHLGRCGSRAR